MKKMDKSNTIDALLLAAHNENLKKSRGDILEEVPNEPLPSFFLMKEEVLPIGSDNKLYTVYTYCEENTGVIYKVVRGNDDGNKITR